MFTSPYERNTSGAVPLTFAFPLTDRELTMKTRIPLTIALGTGPHGAGPKQSQTPPVHTWPVEVLIVDVPVSDTPGALSVMSR